MINYPYLDDKNFLKRLDEEKVKTLYVKINILDFKTEEIISYLEGVAINGTITINGTSSMRRVFSGSIAVNPSGIADNRYEKNVQYNNISEVRNLISMNKKIKIEVGLKNFLFDSNYLNYDIIWFPLGVFVIKNASIVENGGGLNISLTCNDKTALLNGDSGGTIPASTVFSELETYNAKGTVRNINKILIKDIIKELMINFGGENADNIIITDIPDYILQVVKWTGKETLYKYWEIKDGQKINIRFTIEQEPEAENKIEYTTGQNIGYSMAPFVYPGTLECKSGESVSSILDKIKNTLGNFEWFYDVHGRFIFQKKKNYIYDSPATEDWQNLTDKDFLSYSNYSKSVYHFEDKEIITSISNAPQFHNIKNDYVIWGTRRSATGTEMPIRYHLVFDKKPLIGGRRLCIVYQDYRDLQKVIVLNNDNRKFKMPTKDSDKMYYYLVLKSDFYSLEEGEEDSLIVFSWDEESKGFKEQVGWEVCYMIPKDWRTALYFLGAECKEKDFNKNYYFAELSFEWPKLYDFKANEYEQKVNLKYSEDKTVNLKLYYGEMKDIPPEKYDYFLDFLEGDQGEDGDISSFNVENIGRRVKVESGKMINCIYPTKIDDIVILSADGDIENREQAMETGKEVTQISSDLYSKLVIANEQSSAFDLAKELITQHTQYNETVSLSTIPIYYLDVNERISISDSETGVNGDYLIQNITLPLAANGISNITAMRCVEKTI